MEQVFTIEGMTCNGCVASVTEKLESLPSVKEVEVNLETKKATIQADNMVSLKDIEAVLPSKYQASLDLNIIGQNKTGQLTTDGFQEEVESKWRQLRPLFLILAYISVASVLMHYKDWDMNSFMFDFMGLFFLVFSFFKMLDLKGFSSTFAMYDPLAAVFPAYAKIYPFLETVLALMFLLRWQVGIALILTIIVLSITTVGVTRTLLSKRKIKCACLGTALNLPMTEATFIENALMIIMATITIISLVSQQALF